MELEERVVENILLVKPLVKRMDASVANAFKEKMIGWIGGGHHRIVLDLSRVDFVDSSGLGAIVSTHKAIRDKGELAVSGLTKNVMNLFTMTRMNRILAIYDQAEEALRALKD